MRRAQLRALAVRFVSAWANPPVTPEDHITRGKLNWFAGYESCSRRHRHDRQKWRCLLEAANREIHSLQLENLALRLDGLEYPGRPMLMGDLCDWSYAPYQGVPYFDRFWASAADNAIVPYWWDGPTDCDIPGHGQPLCSAYGFDYGPKDMHPPWPWGVDADHPEYAQHPPEL